MRGPIERSSNPCWLGCKNWLRNYRRSLSTTEDTEDGRFKPEEKVNCLCVPRVLRGGELEFCNALLSSSRFFHVLHAREDDRAVRGDEDVLFQATGLLEARV